MPGDCHYLEGNVNAKRRVEFTRKILEEIGIEGQRLQMINVSSAMAGQFAFAAAEITAEIQRLGPNPLRSISPSSMEKRHLQEEEESAQVTDGSSD
jgi:F420-non-reducing hydrogenase iron-sulfur subunit